MRILLLDKNLIEGSTYHLRKKERQYLNKVLRLEVGVTFTAKDDDEVFYNATLIDEETLLLAPAENPEENLLDNLSGYSGPFADITMYISILKGKKNETVVRALTEIGVKKIVFVQSEYTQEKDFSTHQEERIKSIAKEAVQQSGAKPPIIEGPISFEEAIKEKHDITLLLHQSLISSTRHLKDINLSIDKSIGCFIGPEGGFSDQECIEAEELGIIPILLNTNILRAETAAIYSASAIQNIIQG